MKNTLIISEKLDIILDSSLNPICSDDCLQFNKAKFVGDYLDFFSDSIGKNVIDVCYEGKLYPQSHVIIKDNVVLGFIDVDNKKITHISYNQFKKAQIISSQNNKL